MKGAEERMKLKIKRLCGIKKSLLKENLVEIQRYVSNPQFICGKCARVANDGANLCKPKRMVGP